MKITKIEDLEDVKNLYNLFQNISMCEEESITDVVDDTFIDYDDAIVSLMKYHIINIGDIPKYIKYKFDFDGHCSFFLKSFIEDCFDNKNISYDGEYEDCIFAYLLALIISDHLKYQKILFNKMLGQDEYLEFKKDSIPDYIKDFKFE